MEGEWYHYVPILKSCSTVVEWEGAVHFQEIYSFSIVLKWHSAPERIADIGIDFIIVSWTLNLGFHS